MSIPRFLVLSLPKDGTVALDEQESRHASQVLRLATGDRVELFDGQGGSADGQIAHTNKRGTDVQILSRTDVNRELSKSIELIVALPKGDRQKQLIDALVQLGVRKLTPLTTQRSVAQPVAGAIERLARSAVEASKQCGRNQLMEIGVPIDLASLVEPPVSPSICRCFAHPYGSPQPQGLSSVSVSDEGRFVIGPEGGLTDGEVHQLQEAGWQQVSLGSRILRVEMAATAVAAWWSLSTS